MAANPSGEPTIEQRRLFAELRAQYGPKALERANHLGGHSFGEQWVCTRCTHTAEEIVDSEIGCI